MLRDIRPCTYLSWCGKTYLRWCVYTGVNTCQIFIIFNGTCWCFL